MSESKMKEIRKSQGVRLVDLAEKTGISIGWLWSLENGHISGVSDKIKEKVAKVLGSSKKELFNKRLN